MNDLASDWRWATTSNPDQNKRSGWSHIDYWLFLNMNAENCCVSRFSLGREFGKRTCTNVQFKQARFHSLNKLLALYLNVLRCCSHKYGWTS